MVSRIVHLPACGEIRGVNENTATTTTTTTTTITTNTSTSTSISTRTSPRIIIALLLVQLLLALLAPSPLSGLSATCSLSRSRLSGPLKTLRAAQDSHTRSPLLRYYYNYNPTNIATPTSTSERAGRCEHLELLERQDQLEELDPWRTRRPARKAAVAAPRYGAVRVEVGSW